LAALLVVFPAMLNAQEYDVPQTPPAVEPETVVVPETVVAPETVAAPEVTVQDETVAEAPAEEVKAKKEKKVKEKKVKEPKAPKVKEVREEKKEKSYGLFNHLGAGVYGGVMEGLGATVAVPIGGHLQIRGTYSVGVPDKICSPVHRSRYGLARYQWQDRRFEGYSCQGYNPFRRSRLRGPVFFQEGQFSPYDRYGWPACRQQLSGCDG